MHGLETAAGGRDEEVPDGFRRIAGVCVRAAGVELAGRDAGRADLALRGAGIVLERVQCERTLSTDEQCSKEQARQQPYCVI